MNDVNETTEDLVKELIKRLETASEIVEDLVEVSQIEKNYNRDQAYAEMGANKFGGSLGATGMPPAPKK